MIKFYINKSEAVKLIDGLQKLINGNIYDKAYGICSNIGLQMPEFSIDYCEIFTTLGYDDWAYPIGGHKEFSDNSDKWKGKSLVKRVALCEQIIGLLQKTFNIKD